MEKSETASDTYEEFKKISINQKEREREIRGKKYMEKKRNPRLERGRYKEFSREEKKRTYHS